MIANGWLDGYKGLIMRYEYLDVTWIGMLLLGFISKFLKKSLNTFKNKENQQNISSADFQNGDIQVL